MTDAEYLRLFEEGRHGSNKPAGVLRGIRKCIAVSAVPLEPTQATAELPELPSPAHPSHSMGPLWNADQMNAFAREHGERCYADGLASRADVARLEAELGASRAQSEWISVEDRLPLAEEVKRLLRVHANLTMGGTQILSDAIDRLALAAPVASRAGMEPVACKAIVSPACDVCGLVPSAHDPIEHWCCNQSFTYPHQRESRADVRLSMEDGRFIMRFPESISGLAMTQEEAADLAGRIAKGLSAIAPAAPAEPQS